MKIRLNYFLLLPFFFSCTEKESLNFQYADWVDTKIGAIDTRGSNCVIGPRLPYGSISPSPQTEDGGMDGYHPNKPIRGFGQLHVSGTGWGAYGHFLISPIMGKLNVGLGSHDSPHSGDITKAYYYKTQLDRYGIGVEIAPSHYSAIYRFTFSESDEAHLIFDASQAIATDIEPKMGGKVLESFASINAEDSSLRMRIKYSGGWIEGPYDLYLVGKYDKPANEIGVWRGETIMPGEPSIAKDTTSLHVGTYASFSVREGSEVLLKVAISFNSFENAENLLNEEMRDWNFEEIRQKGAKIWEDKLGRIEIETPSVEEKTIFYSALYRFFTLAANRTDDAPEWATGKSYWDDLYAFWDTFRTAYPLMMLIDEDAFRSTVQSLIDRFNHHGALGDGFIAGKERYRDQGGNDVDNIIAEACLKEINGIDWDEAYKILRFNAEHRRIGFHLTGEKGTKFERYKETGWIPNNVMSTSQTLEFAYNDYCVALMAKKLGKDEDYEKYLERSKQWIHLWNTNLKSEGFEGFMDAREEDGTFVYYEPKKYGGSWKGPFYEASSWTYSYFVPHELQHLIDLMGGEELFVKRLQAGHEQKLIAYTNEPSFLATRLFIHAGRPDLTSYWVHNIMKTGYDLTGYPENDDTGSMSSWYIFSAIGLFPNAGQDYYYLNAPLFCKSVIHLSDGKTLIIESDSVSDENIYIKTLNLNNATLDSPIIKHKDIANGGILEMELTNHGN